MKTACALSFSALIALALTGCAAAEGSTPSASSTHSPSVSAKATAQAMSLDDAIKRMYRAYESDYQQMMFMSDIREAAQREVQPRVSAADWSEVDGIRTRVEADVRSRKLTGYNLVSEVMVYGQTMSLLAAGEPIPQTAV